MNHLDPEQLTSHLEWRYATKQFDPSRRIDARTWKALERSLVLTPSSYGLQPWAFVVVNTLETRRQLRAAAFGQAQVEDASHLVVFCVRDPYTESDILAHVQRTAEVRGIEVSALEKFRSVVVGGVLSDPAKTPVWAIEQVNIALGQFMAVCALMGIDTCALGGIQPSRFDEILGLKTKGLRTVVACAAGYRLESDKYATTPKVRFPEDRVLLRV
jgi:nitroreductase